MKEFSEKSVPGELLSLLPRNVPCLELHASRSRRRAQLRLNRPGKVCGCARAPDAVRVGLKQ